MTVPKVSPDEIYKTVGERIGAARRRANLRQEDLAAELGLTRTSVVNIEKGRQRILVHTLLDVARYLRISPMQLITGLADSEAQDLPPSIEMFSPKVQSFIKSGVRAARTKSKKNKL